MPFEAVRKWRDSLLVDRGLQRDTSLLTSAVVASFARWRPIPIGQAVAVGNGSTKRATFMGTALVVEVANR